MKIAVIGSNGSIGRGICKHLECIHITPVRVTKLQSNTTLSFEEFINNYRLKLDFIIDCSTISLGKLFELVEFANKNNSKLIHFSSVSIYHQNTVYSNYKKSSLIIVESLCNSYYVLHGDLFLNHKSYLGYWNYIKLNSFSYFISFRELHYIDLSKLIRCLINNPNIKDLNSVQSVLNTIFCHKSFVSLIFALRLNKLFSFFNLHFIK